MKIDVTPLLEKPNKRLHYEDVWSSDRLDLESEQFSVQDSIRVDFDVSNNEGVMVADGRYEGTLSLLCSRCLTTFHQPLSRELLAEFYAEGTFPDSEDLPENTYVGHYTDGLIDLGEVVRQDILVQCPMKPLCEEDCKGVCPVCGENRNDHDCGHTQEFSDPRLAKLKEIDLENSTET